MILNAWGVVIGRRQLGEADRLCTIYTEELGKLPVRFVGVNKPGRKLKALSEPLAWGEYRLHLSPRSEFAKAVGGRLIGTFPGLRTDLARTVEALGCCELLAMITPERAPNARKYALLCDALTELEAGASPWLSVAFGLRLLELAGFGLEGDGGPGRGALWEALREAPLAQLSSLPFAAPAADALRQALYDRVEELAGRASRARGFMAALAAPPAPAPATA